MQDERITESDTVITCANSDIDTSGDDTSDDETEYYNHDSGPSNDTSAIDVTCRDSLDGQPDSMFSVKSVDNDGLPNTSTPSHTVSKSGNGHSVSVGNATKRRRLSLIG